jgi:hypothetical protein
MRITDAGGHRARSIEIDDARRPLIVVAFRGVATDEELDAYLRAQLDVLERGEAAVMVIDATEAGLMPPIQRKRVIDWLGRRKRGHKSCILGTSFACPSPLVRGALTAILWIEPLCHPHHLAQSRSEAERWGIDRLAACGLVPPMEPFP